MKALERSKCGLNDVVFLAYRDAPGVGRGDRPIDLTSRVSRADQGVVERRSDPGFNAKGSLDPASRSGTKIDCNTTRSLRVADRIACGAFPRSSFSIDASVDGFGDRSVIGQLEGILSTSTTKIFNRRKTGRSVQNPGILTFDTPLIGYLRTDKCIRSGSTPELPG